MHHHGCMNRAVTACLTAFYPAISIIGSLVKLCTQVCAYENCSILEESLECFSSLVINHNGRKNVTKCETEESTNLYGKNLYICAESAVIRLPYLDRLLGQI